MRDCPSSSTGTEMSVTKLPYCFARCQNIYVLKCLGAEIFHAKTSMVPKVPCAKTSLCGKSLCCNVHEDKMSKCQYFCRAKICKCQNVPVTIRLEVVIACTNGVENSTILNLPSSHFFQKRVVCSHFQLQNTVYSLKRNICKFLR